MPRALPLLLVFVTSQISAIQNNWDQTRSIAHSQHEIVMLLIKNNEYDKVLSASKKIFKLNFPKNQQNKLVESAKVIVDCLIHQGQYPLAHQVIDEAIKSVDSNKLKASLYKEKAWIYTRQGKDGEAVKLFEKTVELEKSVQ